MFHQRWMRIVLVVLIATNAMSARAADTPPSDWTWSGQGSFRILARVDPMADGDRAGDERPADVQLDFEKLLGAIAPGRLPDLSGMQVVRHDPRSGEPVAMVANAFGRGPFDVPCRWYDAAIPYEFPEVETNVSSTDGELRRVNRTRLGYFFDCLGDWKSGRLAFVHKHVSAREAAWYGVYFDLLPEGAEPRDAPPRGFLGDGLDRCEPQANTSSGLIHLRISAVDFDSDGLFDLVAGNSRGGVTLYPNRGLPGQPEFSNSQLVFADGLPMDVGWGSAPHAVDWDADGLFDLLVGGERNRLLVFLNRGAKGRPDFEYAGLVKTNDGEVLALPTEPVPEGPEVFKIDYYPVVETVDWDHDGDLDLLAGGYITGRVYWYENVAGPGREPSLRLAGPLMADGQPLDVGWAAAPAVADLDGDGDLDVLSGSMPMTRGGGDAASRETFLYYFVNDGTPREPRLRCVPLPHRGQFPNIALASPRLVDWSGDGLLDLVVSARSQIFLFRNIGSACEPCFDAHASALPSRWGSVPLGLDQFLDWNGDGLIDGAAGANVFFNAGRGSPGIFASGVSVLKPGQSIDHLSGIGDDWQYQRLYDLDGDGRIDLLDADHPGTIWWHRNRGTNKEPDIETEGAHLRQTDGKLVQVGFNRTGFDALQGARAAYTVGDFDADGRPDLVVVDTFGIVRYFRQARNDGAPVFDRAIEMGKLRIRGVPCAADWDGDGRLDVVAGADAANVVVFINRGAATESSPFAPPTPIELPMAPYGAGAPIMVADYNGDGDSDIILQTAYGYTCFYERSFIRSGYVRATAAAIQRRGDSLRGLGR